MPEQTSATETPVPEKPLTPADRAAGPEPWDALVLSDGALTHPDLAARLERLRLVVRGQDRQLAELRHIANTFMRHQHGADGRLVVPVVFGGAHEAGEAPDPAKAWL